MKNQIVHRQSQRFAAITISGLVAFLFSAMAASGAQAGTFRPQYISGPEQGFELFSPYGSSFTRPQLLMPLQETYYFDQLQMAEAWKLTRGAKQIKVAIISTGANYRLPALTSSVAINAGERGNGLESDRIDNDRNGFVDDVYGANTASGLGDPMDLHDIGTYEASLLVSPQFGLAPGIQFIPVAVMNENGSGTTESVIKGIDYAASRGADLILLNLGGTTDDGLCAAIERARVPVITVAGNDAENLDQGGAHRYPALCEAPNAIVTTASDESSGLAYFSSHGFRHVHVAAPGVKVAGLNRFGKVVEYSGGSVAGALTAAVAALVMSYHPEYSVFELREALMRGSDPVEGLADKVMSGGRLNAYKALTVNVR